MISYRLKSLGLILVIVVLACTSCLPGVPGGGPQPTVTAATLVAQPTTPAPAVAAAPSPSKVPAVAAGTVLLETKGDLSSTQGTKLEMAFDAKALQPVTIETTLTNGTPSYEFRLVDKYGNFLATYLSDPGKSAEAITEITLPYDGTFKLDYLPKNGDGSISVKVTALSAPTGGGTLQVGDSHSGLIQAPRTYHTYQVPLTQGQTVAMRTKAGDPATLDTSFVVYGPDGHYLTDADDINPPSNLDALLPDFTAPLTGSYTVVVTTKGPNTGDYAFSVSAASVPPASQGAPDITYDTEYRANFSDKSNLDATFDGSIGDVLQFTVFKADPGVSLDIYVYSPFGQIVAYAVNTAKGRNTTLNELQLPYTGRFKLEIRPSGDGQASFKVAHLNQPPTGGGILSDSQNKLPGRINAPSVFHVYQFDAQAGDVISLAAFSVSKAGTLDLGFALIGPNGRQLAFADDSDSQFPKDPELDNYEIMQSGTYTIIVYSFTNASGTYDMVFTRK